MENTVSHKQNSNNQKLKFMTKGLGFSHINIFIYPQELYMALFKHIVFNIINFNTYHNNVPN